MSLDSVLLGFEVALQPVNLVYVFVGVFIGTVIGVLPGLGPTATIALLLPLTYTMDPATAVIMLAGIYYGSMYGGTITSVLLQLPGEAASVVTTIDGHQMALQGRAGPALGIAAIGSFIGGTVSIIGLMAFAPLLSDVALSFGPPEYTALTLLGLLLVTYLGTRSTAKSLVSAGFGLFLASVGQDPVSGTTRFTFDSIALTGGLEFVAVVMGLFGIGEILHDLERAGGATMTSTRVGRLWPTVRDWAQARGAIMRGSVVGFALGVIPGGGGLISSLASYAIEKRRARQPERFGKGAIEGVAGPETANNAAATSTFIPLLTLGIPSNVVVALLFGALLIQGITPGPQLITTHPEIFWGVIASMFVGNLMLLLLNIPLIGVFVQILRLRASVLGAITVVVSVLGVYSVNNNPFDMWVVLGSAVAGYLMRKTGFPPGPLVLAFILGPIMERSFRQSLIMSDGHLSIFATRPTSAAILALAVVLLGWSTLKGARKPWQRLRAPAGG
ncbi:tripartite tricarboxylate transporter permease [Nonomuraea rhizosphaerae]|uniref:tripartite tricarboxylate transporter permease n=1 Tax=Nonomuraea rhizosphaerae TaxID=2665663 RepID=UPI001C5DBB7E|nr:tripartite tricarboxylate transporter permease [Nonomuraea rhizosphaerae]